MTTRTQRGDALSEPVEIGVTATQPVCDFCSACGRRLIELPEQDGHDPLTGEPRIRVWRQCPRFPQNAFVALFLTGHDSFDRDVPILSREWR